MYLFPLRSYLSQSLSKLLYECIFIIIPRANTYKYIEINLNINFATQATLNTSHLCHKTICHTILIQITILDKLNLSQTYVLFRSLLKSFLPFCWQYFLSTIPLRWVLSPIFIIVLNILGEIHARFYLQLLLIYFKHVTRFMIHSICLLKLITCYEPEHKYYSVCYPDWYCLSY